MLKGVKPVDPDTTDLVTIEWGKGYTRDINSSPTGLVANEKFYILFKVSMKFVPKKSPFTNISVLVDPVH